MSQPYAVLITGGGSGIGAAVARRLTAAGGQVAICGRRAAGLRAVAAETGALDLVCDVGDADAVTRLVESVTGAFGRLDGLVLNAGVMAAGGVADLSPADWSAMVSANLTGAFLVARAALPHLIASRGAVVSVASIAALRAASGMGGYAATKAGLAMLTQSLAWITPPRGCGRTSCARAGPSPRWPTRRWWRSAPSAAWGYPRPTSW